MPHHHQIENMYEQPPYILLIDDDQDDLEMFSSGLENKGIRVKSFESSSKALFYLTLMSGNRELPSLIIMDYNMPMKNGQQVLSMIKANADTKQIPVVIYSTSMSDPLRKQLSDAGALDCFNKPWTYKEFATKIEVFTELSYSFIASKALA